MQQNKSMVAKRLTTEERKERVLKYISLRESNHTAKECVEKVGLSRDTIFKYAAQVGLEKEIRETTKNPVVRGVRQKVKPEMVTIPYEDHEPAAQKKQPQDKKKGNIVIIMGDPESMQTALQNAFNVVNQK